jgi:hypothetical protein
MQHVGVTKFIQEASTMTFLTVAREQNAMQQVLRKRPKTMNPQSAPSVLALLIVLAIPGGTNLPAQSQSPQAAKSARQQKADAPAQPRPPAPEVMAERPPASSAPVWPTSQAPNQARVSWDSHGLEIEAFNSSLNQILHQVAADTGAKLEGLTQDQRVFGRYGPGPGSDVLLKLLDGSGYNVLIIDGRDTAAPLEIVLSARSPAGPQTAANDQNRRNAERLEHEPQPNYSPEPPRPQSVENPFGNGEPPRDPLQYMQEILERQQKIDQQQQQQDQQNNPRQ